MVETQRHGGHRIVFRGTVAQTGANPRPLIEKDTLAGALASRDCIG